jgi:hypothetical protein
MGTVTPQGADAETLGLMMAGTRLDAIQEAVCA